MQIYLITDSRLAKKQYDMLHPLLDEGLEWVQLRNKNASLSDLEKTIETILPLIHSYQANLIINDHLTLAHQYQIGVHLGMDDEDPNEARKILGSEATIGITIHNELVRAQKYAQVASYVGVGPIFATQTKLDTKAVLGIESLRTITKMSPLPVVAIGGISISNIRDVLTAQPQFIAVCGAICAAENPKHAFIELNKTITELGNY